MHRQNNHSLSLVAAVMAVVVVVLGAYSSWLLKCTSPFLNMSSWLRAK